MATLTGSGHPSYTTAGDTIPSSAVLLDQPAEHRPRPTRMMTSRALLLTLAFSAAAACGQTAARYEGLCDASAAVALDALHFVVASDEDNLLRIFDRDKPKALATLSLEAFLRTRRIEADLEGAARIGERIYWIGSLSRDSKGRPAPQRNLLFATDIERGTTPPTLRPVGRGPVPLLDALVASAAGHAWRLADAAHKSPETPGGLNVEGLTSADDGALLIGLRSPLREGKALVLPLRNPAQAIDGQPPEFGDAIALDLDGRGVRAMTRLADGYVVVGGPTADAGSFALFRWRGGSAPAQRLPQPALGSLRPEALIVWAGIPQLQLLSDDGAVKIGGNPCKLPAHARSFRGLLFAP
ncbi:MAG: DUF3616 domain-containing protein [Betaproteobacteria bacterium]|nr:DUF3616 domain-containing protein [Betaproteobacteria bacterium]